MEPFKQDAAVVEFREDDVAVARFLVGRENDAITGIKLMFHAVAFNNYGKGVWIAAVGFYEFVDLVREILIVLGRACGGPTDNRHATGTGRRRCHHQTRESF